MRNCSSANKWPLQPITPHAISGVKRRETLKPSVQSDLQLRAPSRRQQCGCLEASNRCDCLESSLLSLTRNLVNTSLKAKSIVRGGRHQEVCLHCFLCMKQKEPVISLATLKASSASYPNPAVNNPVLQFTESAVGISNLFLSLA